MTRKSCAVGMRNAITLSLSGLSLSRPVDTKTDFNLNNIKATLSLISISSVKKFAGKCPETYSWKLDLNSTRWMPKSVRIDAQSYAALTSQSLSLSIDPLQDNWSLFHCVIGISGILPYNRNVTLQTLELFSAFARLYNAAASPASHLCSAGSLAIICVTPFKIDRNKNQNCSID